MSWCDFNSLYSLILHTIYNNYMYTYNASEDVWKDNGDFEKFEDRNLLHVIIFKADCYKLQSMLRVACD
jgi:hypothetical protein